MYRLLVNPSLRDWVNISTVQNEAYGSRPDLPEMVQKRGEGSKTGAYQTLKLETMDSCNICTARSTSNEHSQLRGVIICIRCH